MAISAVADTHSDPLRQALTRSNVGSGFTYDVMYRGKGIQTTITVDPSRPRGERVSVPSLPREQWDASFTLMIDEMDNEAGTQFWCNAFAENVPPHVELIAETDTTLTYQFDPMPVDDDDEMVMKYLTGVITITRDNPAVLAVNMKAREPFSPILLGRFDEFELGAECTQLPDGRSHVTRVHASIQGKIASETISEIESWQLIEYRELSY